MGYALRSSEDEPQFIPSENSMAKKALFIRFSLIGLWDGAEFSLLQHIRYCSLFVDPTPIRSVQSSAAMVYQTVHIWNSTALSSLSTEWYSLASSTHE